MAQLDIQGFVTPEQQFAGLYKLGDTLQAQQVARQREKAAQEANKKLLGQAVENIDPKDFMTQTIEDGVISNKIYNAKDKLNKFIVANPGIDQASLNSMIAQETKDIANFSQNVKEYKRKADAVWNDLKVNPSADKNKYYNQVNKFFLNPDGSVNDNINTIDFSKDHISNVVDNEDIWDDASIYKSIEKADMRPLDYTNDVLNRNAAGKTIKSKVHFVHNAFFAPEYDNKNILTGNFVPSNTRKATDVNGYVIQVPKLDAFGKPMVDASTGQQIMEDQNLISDEAWDNLTKDPTTAPVIKSKLIKYSKENNIPVSDIRTINAVKHEMYNVFDNYPSKGTISTVSGTTYKIPSSGRGGGGKGGGAVSYRDVYQEISDTYNEGKKGMTGGKLFVLNVNNLKSDALLKVVKDVNDAYPKRKRNATDLYIIEDTNGELQIHDAKTGDLLMPLSQSMNISTNISQGTKGQAVQATQTQGALPVQKANVKTGGNFKGTKKKMI